MKIGSIQSLTGKLIEVEPNQGPTLSCFVTFKNSRSENLAKSAFEFQMVFRKCGDTWYDNFEKARNPTNDYLRQHLETDTQSEGIYERTGEDFFFEALQFKVPLITEIAIDKLPHIYSLIERKDKYDRFVIVVTMGTEAQILETAIGSPRPHYNDSIRSPNSRYRNKESYHFQLSKPEK